MKQRARIFVLNHQLLYFFFALWFLISFAIPPNFDGKNFIQKAHAAGTTYYVDATSGLDTNSGTATDQAWKTIAKVNASAFNPGDQILFKRGEMWREYLNVPSSGNASARIVFGAYGSGDRPEFNGSQQILNADFTAHDAGSSVIFSDPPTTDSHTTGVRNYRMVCPADVSSTTVQIRLTASDFGDFHVNAVSIAEQLSGAAATATPIQVLWDSGSISTTVTQSTYKDSDPLSFNVTAGHTYLVHVYYADRYYKAGNGIKYYDAIADDESLVQTPTGGQLVNGPGGGGIVTEILGDHVTVYKVPSATDPLAVWEDGQFLTKKTAPLTGILGTWYWDGADLYVCASDGSNIITNGKLYEKTSLPYNINDNSQSWLEFKDINGSRSGTGSTVVGARIGGTNNILHDMELYSSYGHALNFMSSKDCRAYNMKLHDSKLTTVITFYGGGVPHANERNILEHSEIYQSNRNCWSSPIVLHGAAVDNIIQYNDIHIDMGYSTSLIFTYGVNTSNTIRYNYMHYTNMIVNAVHLYDDAGSAPGPYYIYGNIMDMTGAIGINSESAIQFENSVGNSEIYNNTIISENTGYPMIDVDNTPNVTVKDNILNAPFGIDIDANSQIGFTSDYNDFYDSGGISLKWGANTYNTLADWQTSTSQDAHSINLDPKLVDPGTDFHLQIDSPCIDAGYDTNISTDYAVKQRYDDPDIPNTGSGTIPWYDIGAYEYVTPPTPTVTSPTYPSQTTWYNSNTPEMQITSDTSSTTSYRYLVDQTPTQSAATVAASGTSVGTSTDFTIPAGQITADGVWYIHIIAQNLDDDSGGDTDYTIKYDGTPPTTGMCIYPAGPTGPDGYYLVSPSINLLATDLVSGIQAIFYHWDAGSDITYTGAFNAPEGIHYLYYYAVDNAGNYSIIAVVEIKVLELPQTGKEQGN